jgi:hypothetical protein
MTMISLRQSEKFGCAAMNFIDEVYKQMGVKVVMFAGWIGEDQDLQFTQYVLRNKHCVNGLKVFLIGWNKHKGSATSFSALHKKTQMGFMEKFRDWGMQQFGKSVNQNTDILIYLTCEMFSEETREIEDSDDKEGGVRRGGNCEINGGKKELWPIEQDKSCWVVLPVYEKTPHLADLKDIIRAMFTHAYCESIAFSMHKNRSATSSSGQYTNNENVSVPWGLVGENPATWLKSWDNNIPVKEPSKIKIKEARDLYAYWLNCQKKHTIVVEFIKANKNNIKEQFGKRKKAKKGKKPDWVEPGSEEEPEQTAPGKGKARELAHTSPKN